MKNPLLGLGELEELRYLRECGFTQAELARCFFVHQTTICTYLRQIGDPLKHPARPRPWRWKEEC